MASKKPQENETKKEVKKMLGGLSDDVYQIMPFSGYGTKGIPDHIASVPVTITQDMVGETFGMFVGIESKKPHGELHGLQPLNIAQIIASSGFAQVADSKEDADRVEKLIRKRFRL